MENLRKARNIFRHEPAFTSGGDGSLKTRQFGYLLGERDGYSGSSFGAITSKTSYSTCSHKTRTFGFFKISSSELKWEPYGRATKMGLPMIGTGYNSTMSCDIQFDLTFVIFRNHNGIRLPPHQMIGMPSLSPTMTEGNIAHWMKKEGDKVFPGEVLCEIETDKATIEMECMEEGYLAKIIKGNGEKDIKVGEIIAITVEEEEDMGKFNDYKPSASLPTDEVKESSSSGASDLAEAHISKPIEVARPEDRFLSSPLAKQLAEDNYVPLSSIKGSGLEGLIVKADVEEFLASKAKGVSAPVSKTKDMTAPQTLDYTDIPHSQIRKVTASRLLLSKQTIPHYYLTVDTCVDKLMDLRIQLNALQEASGGKRISVNDLVIKAAALALRKVPQCNSSWMNEHIRQYHCVNVGVAVQTENGLYVPVVKDADNKGLSKISEEVKYLAQKAKDNNLKPEDYEGGTFTVSNLGGPFGLKQFCAIINPPQSGILAVGSAERRVIPGAGPNLYEFGSFMSVTLSCDHRVIDGAIGAEWLKAFKGYIENPQSMLL
ncbi:hypothetical protein QJS10_CPB11g02121 [Acorus calamus]|uniref:Acetyltransferase component of pyruvate dehydrogenase complex n=1 Tax=Acorus calamus TaxID=4465 RepID=A0AAV9DVG8_ACOCL|nr:hypothetical protein QJS10_CPB11g02121 [Acorus calamus]